MGLCFLGQNVDWEVTKEAVEMLLSVLGATAGLGAVWVAYQGLTTWKKQLVGTEKHQLARAFARAAFEFRARFNEVRHPTLLPTEISTQDSRFTSISQMYPQRFESLQQAKFRLEEAAFEAKAGLLFKENQVDDLMKGFSALQFELLVAVEDRLDGKRPIENLWVVFKPSDSEKDLIGKQLNELVDSVKDLSAPFLK